MKEQSALASITKALKAVSNGISDERGANLYNFAVANRLNSVLELGHNHGRSTCFLAAAMDKTAGFVHSIDRPSRKAFKPNALTLLKRLRLEGRVELIYTPSYNFVLRDWLAARKRPEFDLIFLDGSHLWEPDALAFLLSWRLLKPGGWYIFDDLRWAPDKSEWARSQPWYKELPPDDRTTPAVRQIVDLLVATMPDLGEHFDDGWWAYAQKKHAVA